MTNQNELFTHKDVESGAGYDATNVDLDSNCLKCGVYRTCNHPKLGETGTGTLNTLIIAEASGAEEDKYGQQLVGKVGKYFRQRLAKQGLHLDRDFWKINALGCRPTDGDSNRPPTNQEIDYCRPRVFQAIERLEPHFIWLMGGYALQCFLGDDFRNKSISRWRGLCFPDQKTGAWVMPLYHPSYVMREEKNKNLFATYIKDIKQAKRNINLLEPFDFINPDDHIAIVKTYDEAHSLLKKILREKPTRLAFDYETNALKPYWPGSKIISVSLCYNGVSYALPIEYRDLFTPEQSAKLKNLLKLILIDPKIGLEAHNMKFEHNWSTVILGLEPTRWVWDTMMAAHILDQRNLFTGLKFQTYLNFGIRPYDKAVEPYIKAHRGPYNRMEQLSLPDLLTYNAYDSLFTYLMREKQNEQFLKNSKSGGKLRQAYRFFHNGTFAMAQCERQGMPIDEEYFEREKFKLKYQIKSTKLEILKHPDAIKFEERFRRPIRIKKQVSNPDLDMLFFTQLDFESEKKTGTGARAVDEDVLKKIDHPIAMKSLALRKLNKNTGYINQYLREVTNGRIHPFLDLNVAVSYRGNSHDPNFHNTPKRDKESKRIIRGGWYPLPGYQFGEADFGALEVCIGCCYHKDPSMIKYVTDKSTDMHRDAAADVWMLPKDQVTKDIRFYAKNGWVFPQFYGSVYFNCAENLWYECILKEQLKTSDGTPLVEHINDKGIRSYGDFEDHLKDAERIMWRRFKVYNQWKKDINKHYRKTGYIETHFGFRYTGYLTYNEATNLPIQGTAFHVLLWTMMRTLKFLEEEKLKSQVIAHIHDSMPLCLHPEEVDYVFDNIIDIGTRQTVEEFDWLNVPLTIECELADVDQPWSETEFYKEAA